MKKEIGSIFPLSDNIISLAEQSDRPFSEDRIYYALCREALHDIAQSLSGTNRHVLIPAYTCQTVITAFEEAGWVCNYYVIKKSLRVDVNHLLGLVNEYQPSLVVTHPYFGMDLNAEEQSVFQTIHKKGIRVVLDLTQCLFSNQKTPFADYIVGSYRKWFPIPDGGFLIQKDKSQLIQQPQEEKKEFAERELAAMYLRGRYFEVGEQRMKDISIRLSKAADRLAERQIASHRMSQIAYNLLLQQDQELNQKARCENFVFLFGHVKNSSKITKVCDNLDSVTTAPLYFTIYVQDRSTLQRQLAQNAIYAPVIWPVKDNRVLINEEVKYIYDHLLAIPCDQRYDVNDMQRAVDIINKY